MDLKEAFIGLIKQKEKILTLPPRPKEIPVSQSLESIAELYTEPDPSKWTTIEFTERFSDKKQKVKIPFTKAEYKQFEQVFLADKRLNRKAGATSGPEREYTNRTSFPDGKTLQTRIDTINRFVRLSASAQQALIEKFQFNNPFGLSLPHEQQPIRDLMTVRDFLDHFKPHTPVVKK